MTMPKALPKLSSAQLVQENPTFGMAVRGVLLGGQFSRQSVRWTSRGTARR